VKNKVFPSPLLFFSLIFFLLLEFLLSFSPFPFAESRFCSGRNWEPPPSPPSLGQEPFSLPASPSLSKARGQGLSRAVSSDLLPLPPDRFPPPLDPKFFPPKLPRIPSFLFSEKHRNGFFRRISRQPDSFSLSIFPPLPPLFYQQHFLIGSAVLGG